MNTTKCFNGLVKKIQRFIERYSNHELDYKSKFLFALNNENYMMVLVDRYAVFYKEIVKNYYISHIPADITHSPIFNIQDTTFDVEKCLQTISVEFLKNG